MYKIVVIGTGYVGLVTGTCLAELGNNVICVDTIPEKISVLKNGDIPFFEPGLVELVKRNLATGRLAFTTDSRSAVNASDVVFIAVGTPAGANGLPDLDQVRAAAISVADALNGNKIVINKSTVPVQTADLVASIIKERAAPIHRVSIISNPEFLREGSAILDFMAPDRIVIGVSDQISEGFMRELYAPLNSEIIVTDVRTAEIIKYAANAFLATKISFINEIAAICDAVNADVIQVAHGIGMDKRIGAAFLSAGLGFGGSCFPKDVLGLAKTAKAFGVDTKILGAVLEVNHDQINRVLCRLRNALHGLEGRQIGLLGLAFKPNTDDVRESPSVSLAIRLAAEGAIVVGHDPVARPTAAKELGSTIRYAESPYEAARDADALVVATDWNEYKSLDLQRMGKVMRGRIFFDARNAHDAGSARRAGFTYIGVGRGRSGEQGPGTAGIPGASHANDDYMK